MSDHISDEAVEAACIAWAQAGGVTYSTVGEPFKESWRRSARAALTAAYPLLREGMAAEVISGVRAWMLINEIAEPPLDWAGLGEFLSRVEQR